MSHGGHPVADDSRSGFVLTLVVLLLFGIGVAGAAGYQVVFGDALLSVHAKETQTAHSIARAGLQAYVAKQIGVHEDTATYAIEGGNAVVTARLVSRVDDFQTLYLLGSEGVYTDPTFTGSAARRTVYQYALKREVAVDHLAAMTQVTGLLYVEGDAHVDGHDGASNAGCSQTPVDLIGVMMGSGTLFIEDEDPVEGDPDDDSLGSSTAALDALGIDWDVLTDTDFPVDYQNTWPDCGLPADSFTVTRFNGDLSSTGSACGQGVLIVTGSFTPDELFQWNGIVLAGHIGDTNDNYRIDGLLVSGLDGNGTASVLRDGTHIDYHRCYAFEAGKRLSHFVPVGGTWWEEM